MSTLTSSAHPFAYVESDIPEGLTLVQWRRAHAAPPSHRRLRLVLRRLARRAGA